MIRYKQGQEAYAKEIADRKYADDLIRSDNASDGYVNPIKPIKFWMLFTCAIVPGSVVIETMMNDRVLTDTITVDVLTEEIHWKLYLGNEGMKDKTRKYCVLQWQHIWDKKFDEFYRIKYKVYSDANGGIDPVEREFTRDIYVYTRHAADKNWEDLVTD